MFLEPDSNAAQMQQNRKAIEKQTETSTHFESGLLALAVSTINKTMKPSESTETFRL